MAEDIPVNRRKFLQLSSRLALSIAGLLGLGGLVRYFSHQPPAKKPTSYDLGTAADFPATGKLIRLDIPAVIYQRDSGYRAYSLVCTHLGCTVEEDHGGFSCPCHGSRFDQDGILSKGPAAEDLAELIVQVSADGRLILDTGGVGQ